MVFAKYIQSLLSSSVVHWLASTLVTPNVLLHHGGRWTAASSCGWRRPTAAPCRPCQASAFLDGGPCFVVSPCGGAVRAPECGGPCRPILPCYLLAVPGRRSPGSTRTSPGYRPRLVRELEDFTAGLSLALQLPVPANYMCTYCGIVRTVYLHNSFTLTFILLVPKILDYCQLSMFWPWRCIPGNSFL